MTPNENTAQKKVLEYVRSCGEHGSTYREAAVGCDLSAPTVAVRLRELYVAKLIERPGHKRITSAGMKAFVYIERREP